MRNSDQEKINVFYCYDITDLKNSLWSAIILRNLPSNLQALQITQFCQNINKNVLYSLPTKEILNQNCTIVILDDCDEAERLCYNLNNKEYAVGFNLKARNKFNIKFSL